MSRRSRERAAQAAEAANAAAQDAQPTLNLEQVEPSENNPNLIRPTPQNDPRNDMMNEILAKRGMLEEETAEKPPNAEPVQTPEPAVEPAVEPAEAEIPKTVRAKVDGEEFDAPQADVDDAGGLKAYQLIRASENRLRKANETLAQTRQAQAQLAQWIQAQKPAEPTLTEDQFIQSKVDTVRFGTPEESAVALREILSRTNPRVDQNAIAQMAVSEMMKTQAIDNFKKEFQDVVSNPILLRAAVSLENERKPHAGQQTDWSNFYRTIGNEVRSVTGRPNQPPVTTVTQTADPTSSGTSDREARKASIVNLPTAAARAALPADPKPETREEILASMRKSRGIS